MEQPEPDAPDSQLGEFWALTQRYAHVGDLDVVMGREWGGALPPPAWSFGDNPEVADDLLGLVLDGRKRATSGLKEEYEAEDEPLPRPGDLAILVDGAGRPRALIRDVEVRVTRWADVTAAQAAAEGEGDGTLAGWRAIHEAAWAGRGQSVTADTEVVWERFKVLYPASGSYSATRARA
ncbi:MAG: ASCH domain-containing protein [Propionibacteriaceae bacterium]|jgi:uncharacterized protein YhfF|nr:ASCH domain-containing protein [Propionibacteriaceae bacterium]